ncbi:MAG: anti-sigma factor [Gemmatimonadota bacterium]|nr:anti-sigma factor [Gemmatimonadota bacterium]
MTPNRLTCEETFRRLNDYLDRALSPEEKRLVEEHLETCAGCAREFRFEMSLLDNLRAKLSRIDIPEDMLARITRRLEEARRECE